MCEYEMPASYQVETGDSLTAEERRSNWELAIGLNEVDGLQPSAYLHEVKEENISGHTSYHEVEEKIKHYYHNHRGVLDEKTQECDLVSARIAELLATPDFSLHPAFLKAIHGRLFEGIYLNNGFGKLIPFAGIWRTVAITKSEPILHGASVAYGAPYALIDILDYDFSMEQQVNYTTMSSIQQIRQLGKFCSHIWQAHPFMEGNTRTTAVFFEKYLRTLGWQVNNDFFKDHAVYFRNALVLANHNDIKAGISEDSSYLEAFFSKLLLDKELTLPEILPR